MPTEPRTSDTSVQVNKASVVLYSIYSVEPGKLFRVLTRRFRQSCELPLFIRIVTKATAHSLAHEPPLWAQSAAPKRTACLTAQILPDISRHQRRATSAFLRRKVIRFNRRGATLRDESLHSVPLSLERKTMRSKMGEVNADGRVERRSLYSLYTRRGSARQSFERHSHR